LELECYNAEISRKAMCDALETVTLWKVQSCTRRLQTLGKEPDPEEYPRPGRVQKMQTLLREDVKEA